MKNEKKKMEEKEEKKKKKKLCSSRTFLNFHLNHKSKCCITDLNESSLTSYLS